jgi:Uma2 family endonuclease
MGNVASPDTLRLRWAEMENDPSLRDLPYKIELNAWGKVEMSPASYAHGRAQGHLIAELSKQLDGGVALGEVPIVTDLGIRVPDAAWASDSYMAAVGAVSPLPRAPEICIEIVSPSNTDDEMREKTRAYLAASAKEVWLVSEECSIRYFDANGQKVSSDYPVSIPALPAAPGFAS